jgi:hypothetical protein
MAIVYLSCAWVAGILLGSEYNRIHHRWRKVMGEGGEGEVRGIEGAAQQSPS